jgi:transposase
MPVIHSICCGIDGHAAPLTAGLRRVSAAGQITTELVHGGPTSRELLTFRPWLPEHQCPVVAMERTGVDWKPVYHVLSEAVEVGVAKSHEVRQRPGPKTDQREATWLAELRAQGLITPSCVPPPEMRA